MSKIIKVSLIIGLISIMFISEKAFAQPTEGSVSDAGVVYPIAALGSCKDKADCKNYCSVSEHMLDCVNFAETQGMLKGEDLRISKVVAEKVSKNETPGQCKTKDECEKFCSGKVENIRQCLSFAKELNVLPPAELAQAEKVMKALEGGAKMPGECKMKEDCEKYCALGSHIDECLSFAEAANILSPEELKQAKAVAPYLKNGETPGKCQSKEECDNFCKDSNNFTECLSFAEKVGFVSKEDADMARKVGGVGPGGCKDKASCEAYCNIESNADECANFAIEKGLVDEKTAELMKTGIDQMKQALETLPPEIKTEVQNCLDSKIGADKVQRILNKEVSATKNQGESIQSCFAGIEAKIKALMMQKASASGQEGGKAPSSEDIRSMIPDSVPAEMRAQIEKQIQEGGAGGGSGMGIPGTSVPQAVPEGFIPSGLPTGGAVAAPAGGQAPQIDCSTFAQVPSCSYVPATVQEQCKQCKGE